MSIHFVIRGDCSFFLSKSVNLQCHASLQFHTCRSSGFKYWHQKPFRSGGMLWHRARQFQGISILSFLHFVFISIIGDGTSLLPFEVLEPGLVHCISSFFVMVFILMNERCLVVWKAGSCWWGERLRSKAFRIGPTNYKQHPTGRFGIGSFWCPHVSQHFLISFCTVPFKMRWPT